MAKRLRTCNHVKANGTFCAAIALSHDDYCYFHRAARERHKRQARHQRDGSPLQVPLLEDRETIQIALSDVVNALLADRMDARKAALVLYALQTAASNARDLLIGMYTDEQEVLLEYTEHEQATLERELDDAPVNPATQSAETTKKDPATVLPRKKSVSKIRKKLSPVGEIWRRIEKAKRRAARRRQEAPNKPAEGATA
jgi:paraquat-inducible protein B